MAKKKKKSALNIVMLLVMLAAIGIFCYAAYQLFLIFAEYKEGEDEYDSLRTYIAVEEDKESEGSLESEDDFIISANEVPSCPITVDFESLKAVNEDVVGWIYVEALPQISYPIVQGDNNDYYLTRTVERVHNSSASIFIDYRNSSDFSDSNTIIYGHNMKNRSMFGRLSGMLEEDIYSKSSYIWVATPEEDICYEIFSTRHVSEMDSLYGLFNSTPEEFKPALEGYLKLSEVPYNMTFDGTEKIITLSTCTSNDSVRCIVQAVRKDF